MSDTLKLKEDMVNKRFKRNRILNRLSVFMLLTMAIIFMYKIYAKML